MWDFLTHTWTIPNIVVVDEVILCGSMKVDMSCCAGYRPSCCVAATEAQSNANGGFFK